MAKLIIRNSVGEIREFPLADRDLRVGRGDQNDVVLPDPEKAVSRFHAELRHKNGSYVLVDTNSPNGIWVDGRREPEVELRPGVEAMIGQYTLSVESAAPATEKVAAAAPPVVSSATAVPTRALDPPLRAATHAGTQLPGKTQPPKPPSKTVAKPSNAIWIATVAVLLIVTVVVVVGLRRRSARIADERRRVAELQLAQQQEQVRQHEEEVRQREDEVRQHLAEAQRLVESRQFDEANVEIDRVLELDPSNADVAQLREKIQALSAAPAPPPPPGLAPVGPKKGPGPGSGQGQGRGSGSGVSTTGPPPAPPADPRAKALQDRYEQGKNALLAGDYATANRVLEALVRDEPKYPDAASLLEDARTRLRGATQAAATKAENSGDWLTALKLYGDAQRLGVANSEDQNRVRLTMAKVGSDAFNQAKQYYAYRQFEKALPLYQRAYDYLPDSDPNRKVAKNRLDELNAKH